MGGKLSRLVYLAPRPGFESGSVIGHFLLHHILGIFSCKRCEHYFSHTEMFTSNVQLGYPCPRGGGQAVQAGLSCPPPPPPHPGFGLGQAVSSINSYCTIILEYLVVRDINIILVKLRCLYPTFSLVILVRGVGGKLSRLVYLAPPYQELSQAVSSVNSYCTITLEHLVVRDVNIISVKRRRLHLTFSSVILVRGVGGKLSRLVYLAPCTGFGSNSVIS